MNTLENSEAARMMANVAYYIAKVSMQMKTGGASIAKLAQEQFIPIRGKFINQIIAANSETADILKPVEVLASLQKQQQALDIKISGLIGYTAAKILDNISKYDRKIAAGL